MTGILGQLKWESLKKIRKFKALVLLVLLQKGLKGKARLPHPLNTDRGGGGGGGDRHSLAFHLQLAQLFTKTTS